MRGAFAAVGEVLNDVFSDERPDRETYLPVGPLTLLLGTLDTSCQLFNGGPDRCRLDALAQNRPRTAAVSIAAAEGRAMAVQRVHHRVEMSDGRNELDVADDVIARHVCPRAPEPVMTPLNPDGAYLDSTL